MHDMTNVGECCQCKAPMWIPTNLYNAAKCSEKIMIYCGYGHVQHFRPGESEADKLRRERDRAVQQQARLEEEKREAVARAEKAEAATKRLKKRAAAGSCPCCTRTFTNMERHIKTKHPDWRAEAVKPNLKVVA